MVHHPEEPCHSMLWSLRWTSSAEAWHELEARCVLSELCTELEAQGSIRELEAQEAESCPELGFQEAVTLSIKPEGLGSWSVRGAACSEVHC